MFGATRRLSGENQALGCDEHSVGRCRTDPYNRNGPTDQLMLLGWDGFAVRKETLHGVGAGLADVRLLGDETGGRPRHESTHPTTGWHRPASSSLLEIQ